MNDTPGIGHNIPLSPEALIPYMEELAADEIKRFDELIAAAERAPAQVENDEQDETMTTYTGQISACIKALNDRRAEFKKPFDEAGKAVQAFFKSDRMDKLTTIRNEIDKRQVVYKRAKAERERAEREEAARIEREKADAARKEAAERENAKTLAEAAANQEAHEAAADAEESAIEAEKEAQASDADLSRTRGEHGTQTAIRTRWTFEVENPDDIQWGVLGSYIDKECRDKAIRAFMREGGRVLKGVRIFEEDRMR